MPPWSSLWRGAAFRRDTLLVALIALCTAWLGLWAVRPVRFAPPSRPAAVATLGAGVSHAPVDDPRPAFDPHFQAALDARQTGEIVLALLLAAEVVALAFAALRVADEFALLPGCAAVVAFVSAALGHPEARWKLALLAAAACGVIWRELFRHVGLAAVPRAVARRG